VTEPVVSCSGATGIACADAMPRPTAKAIEAKSFICFPPRSWKAGFHRNAAEYAMKGSVGFSPQYGLRGSAFSQTQRGLWELGGYPCVSSPSRRDGETQAITDFAAGANENQMIGRFAAF
jgi:hypothetical protein